MCCCVQLLTHHTFWMVRIFVASSPFDFSRLIFQFADDFAATNRLHSLHVALAYVSIVPKADNIEIWRGKERLIADTGL